MAGIVTIEQAIKIHPVDLVQFTGRPESGGSPGLASVSLSGSLGW